MRASTITGASNGRIWAGRRKLLSGTCGAALALALLLPSAAWADDYVVTNETELQAALTAAAANADPSATITLGSSFQVSNASFTLPNKPVTIDTQGFVLTGPTGGPVTIIGPTTTLNLAGTISGASGGGGYGAGLTLNGGSGTVNSTATITGGAAQAAGQSPATGLTLLTGTTFVNDGTIRGGDVISYALNPNGDTAGAGVAIVNSGTLINNGLIQGSNSQGDGAGPGLYLRTQSTPVSITNTGTIRGGSDVNGALAGNFAIGGFGNANASITNSGTIEGGNGAVAIDDYGTRWVVTLVNSGVIKPGDDQSDAIRLDGDAGNILSLELRAGSDIQGNVIARAGSSFSQTLQLGGSADADFDMSKVGAAAQYRNFTRFVKSGASTWTLTGNAAGMPSTPWELQQGTLVFDENTAAGQLFSSMISSGTVIFRQDGNVTVGAIGGGSVIQSGSGTTTLTAGAGYSYSGLTITGGKLSVDTEAKLGNAAGAFTIDGGTLQWTGSGGSIVRTINWGASGGGFEVTTGSSLIITQPLLGGGALTKSGTGVLTLAGNNTYTGGTTIAGGALNIGNGGTVGSVLGDIVNNATLAFNRSDAYTYAGSITGTGGLSKPSTGTLTLTGQNSYGGLTSISGGQFLIAGGGTTTSGGSASINVTSATAVMLGVDGAGSAFSTASISGAASLNRNITVSVTNGGHLTTRSGDISLRASTVSAASTNTAQLIVDGAGSLADVAGGLVLAGSSITNGKLTITGGGALHTAGASTIGFATGNTRGVPSATITGAGSNWASTNSLAMSNGDFAVDQSGTASFTNASFGTASLPATLTVSGTDSRFATTIGDLVIGSGTGTASLTLKDGGAVNVAGSLILANAGTATGILNIGGAEGDAADGSGSFTAPAVSLGSATSRLNFNHTDPLYSFDALIGGTGAVNQVAGTTLLTADNNYSGATNITGGTLRINGDQSLAAGLTTIANGGTLGGGGTIGGSVFVDNGGTLAPGNSPGTLTINGDLTLSNASLLDYEFGHSNIVGGPLNDLTVVGGNLALDGTIDVTVTAGGSFDVGLYRVISYAGTLNDQGLVLGSMPGGSNVLAQTSIANQVNLVNIAGADVNFWDGNGARGDSIVSGGDGVWQNASGNDNWTLIGGSLNTPYPNDAFAIFSAAPGTVTVDATLGAVNASGMQFASDGYILTGDVIGLTGTQSTIRVGDGTAAGAGFTATIAADMTGAGNFVKTDLGKLVLTGTSTFSDSFTVAGGSLQVADGGVVDSVGGATSLVQIDANLIVTGPGSLFTTTNDLVAGRDTGSAWITVENGGQLTVGRSFLGENSGAPTTSAIDITVDGVGSLFTTTGDLVAGRGAGTTTITVSNGGQLTTGRSYLGEGTTNSAASAISVAVDGAGSIFDAGFFYLGAAAGGTATLTISDGGLIKTGPGGDGGIGSGGDGTSLVTGVGSQLLADSVLYIGSSSNGGAGHGQLTIQDGGLVAASVVAMGYNDTVTSGSTGILTLLGTAGSRGVLETGSLSRGYGDASIRFDGGVLRATADNSDLIQNLGADELIVTLGANGGFIDSNGHDIGIAPRFVGAGGLTKQGAGMLTLTGANSYAGLTTINVGTLQLGDGGQTGSILGDVVDNGVLAFNRSDDVGFDGLISGSGAISQRGSGTTTLTGTNSYAGVTNVDAGTLLINGDQSAATGLTSVAAGATLGGNGIIGGSVDMTAGGTLAAGSNGIGTLAINGNLTLSGTSTLVYEFGVANAVGSPLNDLVNVGGNLTLDGTINVTQSAGGLFDIGIYRVFNYSGALTDNGLTVGSLPAGGVGFVQTSVAGQVNLVNTAGLDLTFWDGDGGPKFNNTVNGGNGVWRATTGDNWTDITGAANASYSNGAIAIFSAAAGTVTVDNGLGAVTASGMQFASTGYVVTGDTVTLTGAQATVRVGDGSAASAGYTATIVSELTGSSQLVKTDLGTLALLGDNSYTGGTRIDGGTLRLGNGGATGSITGDIFDNGVLVVNRSGTLTLDGAISGTGTLVKLGGGTLILSGTNSYAGGSTVGGGTVKVSSDANLGDVAGTLSLQGGTFQAAAAFSSARGILLGSGNSNTIDTQGFDITLSGVIGDGSNNSAGNFVNKIGSGRLTLTGANSYSNRTVIAGGTLALAGNGTAGAGNLVIAAGTVFDISQTNAGARVVQLNSGPAGSIALGSKVLTLGLGNSFSDWSGTIADGGIAGATGGSVVITAPAGAVRFFAANSYTGGTTVAGGTFVLAGNGALYSGGAVTVNGGSAFDISGLTGAGTTIGDLSGAGAIALAGKSLTFGTANSTVFSGTISGAGGALVKNGTGTFTLSGANNYTGTTAIDAGTLLVNGNQSAATGLTSVGSGATLGGSGTIGGNVVVADGGTLSPGNSPGTLTINGNLTLGSASTLAYEFGTANAVGNPLNDLVQIGGNLTLDGTIDVAVSAGGNFGLGLYRVVNYGGSLIDNGLAIGTMPAGAEFSVQTSIPGQVNLVNAGSAVLNFWDGNAGPKFNGTIDGGNGLWQATGTDYWADATGAINAAYTNGGFAIFGGKGGLVTVDSAAGQVAAAGMQFATGGYTIAGSEIALTGPQATIRVGDGSTAGAGYIATINAVLSGATELVKTDAGTLVLGGANLYTGGTRIDGGTVQVASDVNLGAAAGQITLDGGTLATSADMTSARAFVLAGSGTLATAGATRLTLTGQLSGSGALTKAGAGTLVLTGDNGGYIGGLIVVGGTLAVTGTLGSAVSVSTGSRLEGTGRVGAVTNTGIVAPGRGGFGTLTVASYFGSGGRLEIETALGGDNSPTDLLVVNGATSGATAIDVLNRGGLGDQTRDGIKIVDVAGASDGVFALDGDYVFEGRQAVIVGAYGYRLYKNGVSTPSDGDWYLRSNLLDGGMSDTPDLPLYQPGVPVYEAYGQTMLALTEIGTMQERIGNRQWAPTSDGKSPGIWGRMEAKRTRPNATQSTSLTDVNLDSWKFELGADRVLSERSDGATLVLSILGSYGEAKARVASPFGNGTIKTKGFGAGATLTWFGPKGFYVDGRAQVTWFDSKLKSAILGTLADGNDGTGQAYSIEVGKRAPISRTLSLTPQIQAVYSTVGFDRFTDPNGAEVSSKLGNSFKTRWGLSLDRQDARSHVYAVANLSYEWLDGTIADVSGTPIAHSTHRFWGEFGLGGSVTLGKRVTFYGQASANTALQDFGKSYNLRGTVGLRLAF